MFHLAWPMNLQTVDFVETSPKEWAHVRRSDLYTLFNILVALQTGLESLCDADGTMPSSGPANKLQARDALNNAIVDLRKWIVQVHSADQH
jgi:hypothetical protein